MKKIVWATLDCEASTYENLVNKTAKYYENNNFVEAKYLLIATPFGELHADTKELAKFNQDVLDKINDGYFAHDVAQKYINYMTVRADHNQYRRSLGDEK